MKKESLRNLWWFFVFPAVLVFIVYPFRPHGFINPHDEGVWLGVMQSLLEGKKLYKDVWFQYGPLLVLPVRWVFYGVEPTLYSIRLLFWLGNALGLLIVYGALLRFISSRWTRLMASVFIFMIPNGAHILSIPMAARYGVGFLPLLFWGEAPRWIKKSGLPGAFFAGLAAGLSYWVSQEVGVAAFVASGFYFWGNQKKPKPDFIPYLVGFLSVVGAGFGILLLNGSFVNYVQGSIIDIGFLMGMIRLEMPSLPWALWWEALEGRVSWLVFWQSWADFLAAYLPSLSCAVLVLWAVVRRFLKGAAGGNPSWAALTVFTILTAISAWGRSDRWHFYFSLTPGVFLWTVLLQEGQKRWKKFSPHLLLAYLVTVALLVVPPFWGRSLKDRVAPFYQRATVLKRVGPVQLPVSQANGYEILVNRIHSLTQGGEPVFYFPYNGAIYFLANRPNPGPFPVLADGLRHGQQEMTVSHLRGSSLKWVVWDKNNTHFDGVPVEKLFSTVHAYIKTHFEVQQELGPFLFLEKKSE